jgi:tetratricopeptide (TPR) repeat protein
MKLYFRQILGSLVLLLLTTNLFAQNLAAYQKAGDDAFAKEQYYNAMHYYDIVLKSKKTADVYYKYAEAARLSYAYESAEKAYSEVIKSREKRQYPLVEYYYGMVLKHNGKYNDAKRAYKYFLDSYTKETFYRAKAQQEYNSCDIAKQLVKDSISSDSVLIVRLDNKVNTPYSDFGAHEIDNELYYSSLRFDRKRPKGEKKDKETRGDKLVSKLLTSEDKGAKKGVLLDVLNDKAQHTGNSTLSHDGTTLYFTRCSGKKTDSLRCEIYKATKKSDGTWGTAVRLPNPINSNSATTTHPQIAWDADSETEWLYFVSDRAGGEGDLDIWRVALKGEDDSYEPLNLGAPINTKDAEVTPYYDSKRKRLYFASQWHYGLGGYDIFYSEDQASGWSDPINMGVPFNSAANDLYYVVNADDTSGYFASNRDGSRTITKEACCNDIYRYDYQKSTPLPPPDTPVIVQVPVVPPDTIPNTVVVTTVDTPVTAIPIDTPVTTVVTTTVSKLNDLLPLQLYFHNDEPDSNTMSIRTNTLYEESYNHYISLIDKYKQEYAGQFNPERAVYERDNVDNFFTNDVEGEYNRTGEFITQLAEVLEQGKRLKLYIRGYTSPRASERYNIALAHRRVLSMRSYILRAQNNRLQPYVNNGQLIIKEAMLGESVAPKGISDEYEDSQNSIFGLDASRERKAEISVIVEQ